MAEAAQGEATSIVAFAVGVGYTPRSLPPLLLAGVLTQSLDDLAGEPHVQGDER